MKELFEKITASPETEARWLHTVSLLEFIGSRKIAKTVCSHEHPREEILQHYADEVRHAYAFKKLAKEVNGGTEPGYLCEKEAIAYFQTLDHTLSGWLLEYTHEKNAYYSYLLTTSLIERRAMKLYPAYRAVTKDERIANELKQVILEESSHKGPIDDLACEILSEFGDNLVEKAQGIEDELFQKFSEQLTRALN